MGKTLSKAEVVDALKTLSKEDWLEVLVEALSESKVIELADLKTALEDKWGVKAAAAAVAVAAAPAEGGGGGESSSESTDFEVTLAEFPAAKKIAVIKIIREITGLGLKEARDVAEGVPKVVKESVPKSEADEIAKKFEEAGAKVTMKGL